MTIILIVLASTLISAFLLGSFGLGYYLGTKKPKEEKIKVTDKNSELINEVANWMAYRG